MSVEIKRVLEMVQGSVILKMAEKKDLMFGNAADAETSLTDRGGVLGYEITGISAENGAVVLTLGKVEYAKNDLNASWIKENIEAFGTAPSIFDGI